MKSSSTEWLTQILPPIQRIRLRSEPDYYGIGSLIARDLGYRRVPRSFAQWLHGWIFTTPITSPREITFWGNPKDQILVTTDDQVQILRSFGYKNVYAAGLPFIYGNRNPVIRQPNSLLVMPSHASAYTEQLVNQENYIQFILKFKSEFDQIIFCLHGSCVEKKYWIPVIEKYGFPWIIGASTDDRNALIRMNSILRSFSHMTTNVMGSHVAYAATAGCRISIAGDYASPQAEEYRNDPWYDQYPDLLKKHIELFHETEIHQRFSQFFRLPIDGETYLQWGEEQVGMSYQICPQDLAQILGWTPFQQLQGYTDRITQKLTNTIRK
jgi:hypothetical protein